MARRDTPVFVCDAAGCKSTCTLSPTTPPDRHAQALTERGWLAQPSSEPPRPDRHFCPSCKTAMDPQQVEPTDTE